MRGSYLFTSESVSNGHPDKLADQISDAVLDAAIRQTANANLPIDQVRVGCETLINKDMVIVTGEMRANILVEVEKIAREVIRQVGYNGDNDKADGFHCDTCAVMSAIGPQSPDIAQGVDEKGEKDELGAGDQGMMFGYACRETESLMPMPIDLAHRLMIRHAELRKSGQLPWLRPDAKSQVSVRYEDGKPTAVQSVVLSTQHSAEIDGKAVVNNDSRIREAVIEEIIKPTIGEDILAKDAVFHINPTGIFVKGGPKADCGLTGRKIIVDTYGGAAPHGGGAFSGKDPTKVDRSAAYAMRQVAKCVVAAGLADKCLVQVAYAIGVAEPVSFSVFTYGTGTIDDDEIALRVRRTFDLTPRGIIRELNLWNPIYQRTAAYGHFGRENSDFTWENTDKAKLLQEK